MISFSTTTPHALLSELKKAIDERKITTWSHANGYFTHTPEQWRAKAWLLPTVVGSELRFGIIHPQGMTISTEIYAIYHGRFIEMMLAHFDSKLSSGWASALPTAQDKIRAA